MTNLTFRQLLDTYQDMVYRIALNYTKNPTDAQDISQEVFLRLFQRNADFDSESYQKAWLIRVTINLCKNHLRSKWHQIMRETFDPSRLAGQNQLPDPEQYLVTDAMKHLPDSDRNILHLYYYEEFTTAEISQILDIRETAVRKRLSRARKRLEKLLKEEFFYEKITLDTAVSK